MKTQIQLLLLFLFAVQISFAQQTPIKISQLPTATGTGAGGFIPVVQGGITKKISPDSIIKPAIKKTDSIAAVLTSAINQNTSALGTKQNNLITGINSPSINGIPLANNPNNIVISGASAKPLYKSIISSSGIATWNFDSSSTVSLINQGTANLQITGSVPTGATGVLVFEQGSINTDLLKYNNTFLNIGRAPGKISLVGFYKSENGFIFSIDTSTNVIAQAGGGGGGGSYEPDATALFAAAGTNNAYKEAVNNAILGLKAINLAAGGTAWSKSVLINGRAGTSLAQQSYNWRNPAQYNYSYVGTFTVNPDGTQFNGTDNYINTGLVPSLVFTGTTSDISVVNIIGVAPSINGIFFGVIDLTTPTLFFKQYLNGDIRTAFNFSSYAVTPVPVTGRYVSFYSTGTTFNQYRNGTLLDSRTVAPTATFANNAIFEGAGSDETNTPGNFTNPRIDVTQIINAKLTVAEAQAIDAVWAAYQTALNR